MVSGNSLLGIKTIGFSKLDYSSIVSQTYTMKAVLRNTYVTYGAHFKTCQTPTFCKVLCLSFLEVSVQPFFFQVPPNLISFGLIWDSIFPIIKTSLIIALLGILHFGGFKVFHSYLIAFRQTLEGTQDLTISHWWKTSALLKGHKKMHLFPFLPN